MKKIVSLVLVSLILLLPGCGSPAPEAQIAATTLPVYDFTAALCQGTPLTVTRLVTEEVSCLHDYTLNVKQVKAAEAAQVIVISGAGLEEFLEDLLLDASIIDASQGIALIEPEEGGHDHTHQEEALCEEDHGHTHHEDSLCEDDHGHTHHEDVLCEENHEHTHHEDVLCEENHEHTHHEDVLCEENHEHTHREDAHGHEGHFHAQDPHIWLSPANAMVMSANICQGLSQRYPQYRETFHRNLQALLARLEDMDAYGREQLADLSCRELITFHDGFAYLAQAYDLTILDAIEEESGSEASAKELIHMIEEVRHHRLSAIFTEKSGSVSAAGIIARETGASAYALDMAMAGSSYFDAMYHNIDTLKEALQ